MSLNSFVSCDNKRRKRDVSVTLTNNGLSVLYSMPPTPQKVPVHRRITQLNLDSVAQNLFPDISYPNAPRKAYGKCEMDENFNLSNTTLFSNVIDTPRLQRYPNKDDKYVYYHNMDDTSKVLHYGKDCNNNVKFDESRNITNYI